METHYQNSYWYNQNQPQQGNYNYNYDQSYDYNSYYYPPYNYYYQQQEVQQQQPINEIHQNIEIPPVFQAHEEPWSIPTAIRQIFNCLPISEVKVMRKVCKKWNEEGRKILQEKVTIELGSFKLLDSYCRDFKNKKHVSFFGSSFSLGPEINLNSLQLKHFCTYFGSQIKSLEINSQIGIELLKEFLQENNVLDISHLRLSSNIIDPNSHHNDDNNVPIIGLQNLKSLHFLRGESNKPENLKMLLKEIVCNAPNLEIFGLTKVKNVRPPLDNIDDLKSSEELQTMLLEKSDLDQELWSFLLSSPKETLRKLKKINLNPPKPLTIESVQKLSQRKFHLETLELKLSAQVTNNKALHNLLTSLKDSIKNIKIHYCGNGNRLKYEADLPLNEPLLKLVKLELVEYKGNLFFIENVPNLQHLILRNVDLNGVVLKDVDSSKKKPEGIYETLKTLQVYQDKSNNCGNHKQRSIQTVQKLGIQFPSIRKLRLEKLADESLCLLYAQWPNLEELEIVHGQFSDAGTTAIHPNAYKVILREQAWDNFILNVDALRQGLFLGNLSRLHTLKLHSSNITDVTLILGVLQCANIQTLFVKSHNITDAALYRLLKLTTIKHLVIEDCKLSPEAVSFACRKLNERGGTSSLTNQGIGTMDVFQVVEFLQRSPKLKVLLKRVSNQEEKCDKQVVHEENPEIKLTVSNKNNRPMPARRQMMMRKVNGSTEEKAKQSMTIINKESCNESCSIDTSTTPDPIEVIPRKRARITRNKPDFIESQVVPEKNVSDEIIAQESNLVTTLEPTETPPIGLRPKTRRNKIKDLQQETTKIDNGESLPTKVQNIVILENNVKPKEDSKSKEAQAQFPANGRTKRRPTRDQQKPIFIRFKDFALF